MKRQSDSGLKQAVQNEMKWETRIDETRIGVAVQEGVVTLTGSVESFAQRLAAQEAAHRVAGVLDVANDIEVKSAFGMHTDSDIAQSVRAALEWDVLVPDTKVKSTVSKGWITLEGTVETMAEREDAERAIQNLRGVSGVTNRIVVAPRLAPSNLRMAIEDALERQADREAERIKLEIEGGTVTLRGTVHSYAEKKAVLGAVRGTRGVEEVRDQLTTQPWA